MKEKVYALITPGDATGKAIDISILALIVVNVVCLVLETVDSVYLANSKIFNVVHWISLVVFSAEYVARLWTCTVIERFKDPVKGRLKFALKPMMVIDLLAVISLIFPLAGLELSVLRIIRLARLFQIAKLFRYTKALNGFIRVLKSRKEELILCVYIFFILILFVSSLMYFAEREAQPDKFGNILQSMWWASVTLTTVGYGDVYPVTWLGKIIAGITGFFGVLYFALPTSILGAAFLEDRKKNQ